MDFQILSRKLTDALKKVLNNDSYLLANDINEPTISHRLAVYLEPLFPDFNVDCEYNGNIDSACGRKYIYILKDKAEELGILKTNDQESELFCRWVYPDIIIHKRGLNGSENNLLIIEIKKSSNPNDGAWDKEKLLRFTSAEYDNYFSYQYGIFVKFIVGSKPSYSIQWYQDGKTTQYNQSQQD